MTEPARADAPYEADVSYEASGYDSLTLRAAVMVTVGEGKRVFRSRWVNSETAALKSLIDVMVNEVFKASNDDRNRHLERQNALQGEVEQLRSEINRIREAAAKTDISTLMTGFREVQGQRTALEVEVTRSRAQLTRIRAAIDGLNKAVGEL